MFKKLPTTNAQNDDILKKKNQKSKIFELNSPRMPLKVKTRS